jgi:hypothetical protein|tara:strand:- start:1070 stop:1363 length:294 start_codon:yes stop_codon:yes gene_type:complete
MIISISRELTAWQRDARVRNAGVERAELVAYHRAHYMLELSCTRPQLLGRNRAGNSFWLVGGDASHIFVKSSIGEWRCISKYAQIAPVMDVLNPCVE